MEMASFRAFIVLNEYVFFSYLFCIILLVTGHHHVGVFGGNLFYLLDSSFHHDAVHTLDARHL